MLPLPRPGGRRGPGHLPDPLLAGAADRPGRLRMPYLILLFAGGLRGFHHRPQFKHEGLTFALNLLGAAPRDASPLSLNLLGASVSLLNAKKTGILSPRPGGGFAVKKKREPTSSFYR